MIRFIPDPATPPVVQVSLVSPVSSVSSQQIAGNAPEPMTLELFIGGLAFFGLYSAERARRLRDRLTAVAIMNHGPL